METPRSGQKSGELERSSQADSPSERRAARQSPRAFSFPFRQGLSTRNPCRGAPGNERATAASTLKSSPKSSRPRPDIANTLCRSRLHLGTPCSIPHLKASCPSLHRPLPRPGPGVRASRLPSSSFLLARTTHRRSPPAPRTPAPPPSLHCSPACPFPPPCSSCHNSFGFARVNTAANYRIGSGFFCAPSFTVQRVSTPNTSA